MFQRIFHLTEQRPAWPLVSKRSPNTKRAFARRSTITSTSLNSTILPSLIRTLMDTRKSGKDSSVRTGSFKVNLVRCCKRWQHDYLTGSDHWWTELKAGDVADYYWWQQCEIIYGLVDQYRATITSYKQQLIIYYTCSYTCALGSSCLTFNQKCYTTHW